MRYLLLLSLYLSLPLLVAAPIQGLPDFTTIVNNNNASVVHLSSKNPPKNKQINKQLEHYLGRSLDNDNPVQNLLNQFLNEITEFDPRHYTRQSSDTDHNNQILGTGFVYSADGYIVTNYNLIQNFAEVIVHLHDKTQLKATLIGFDENANLALLKVASEHLSPVKFSDKDQLQIGSWLLTISAPSAIKHSVRSGIVRFKQHDLIETDIMINIEELGSPIFDLNGDLIAITAQMTENINDHLGFANAFSVTLIKNIIEQIKNNGAVARGWLGILIQEVTPDLATSFAMDKPYGALIVELLDSGPAKQAGFKSGDVILTFDKQTINTSSELPGIIGQTPIGKTVNTEILRNGQLQTIQVTVGKLPNQKKQTTTGDMSDNYEYKNLGLTINKMTAVSRKATGIETGGVLVEKITKNAEDAGIKVGDVIVMFNRQQIDNPKTFANIVAKLKPEQPVPMLINRNGSPTFLAIKSTQ